MPTVLMARAREVGDNKMLAGVGTSIITICVAVEQLGGIPAAAEYLKIDMLRWEQVPILGPEEALMLRAEEAPMRLLPEHRVCLAW